MFTTLRMGLALVVVEDADTAAPVLHTRRNFEMPMAQGKLQYLGYCPASWV
jgi:hypothetical protein